MLWPRTPRSEFASGPVSVDTSFVNNALGRDVVDRNPTYRGRKATKVSLLVDAKGPTCALSVSRTSMTCSCCGNVLQPVHRCKTIPFAVFKSKNEEHAHAANGQSNQERAAKVLRSGTTTTADTEARKSLRTTAQQFKRFYGFRGFCWRRDLLAL